jgi:hypothetical protein
VSRPAELVRLAGEHLQAPVLAAGIFGLQDNYGAITLGGIVGSTAADAAADVVGAAGSPLATGIGAAAGIHGAREANAAAQGLTVRMLVAVTEIEIVVMEWHDDAPGRTLATFDRATSHVTVTKFGASRRVTLATPAGQELHLTGSTGFLSSEAAADKTVLALLS